MNTHCDSCACATISLTFISWEVWLCVCISVFLLLSFSLSHSFTDSVSFSLAVSAVVNLLSLLFWLLIWGRSAGESVPSSERCMNHQYTHTCVNYAHYIFAFMSVTYIICNESKRLQFDCKSYLKKKAQKHIEVCFCTCTLYLCTKAPCWQSKYLMLGWDWWVHEPQLMNSFIDTNTHTH